MFSNPLDGPTQERINNLITEIVTGFATQFPVSYTIALVDKCKQEVNPPHTEIDDLTLETPPVPSEPLKTGFMTKRGDAHKTWKKRFCVAMNAADNYRIDYFESEGGKQKGSINCAGYRAEKFSEDDETQYGPCGIKLVPWQRMRRTWYIRCENEEDRTEWMKTFENACWRAHAPEDPNPLIAAGFRGAFQVVRYNYGYWGWYYGYGSEEERLADFIREVLARDIVDAVLGNIADGFFRAGLVNMVETTIGTAVRAAVTACWKAAVSAVNSITGTIEATAKANLGPIFEQQKLLKDKIIEMISGTTSPFFSEYGGKIMKPLLDNVSAPISRAFVLSIKALHEVFKTKLESGDFSSAGKRIDAVRWIDRQADYWYSGPISKSREILYDMYSSAGAEVFAAGGFSLWAMRRMCMDNLQDLFHRATYTFNKLCADDGDNNATTHAATVMRRYLADAKTMIKYSLMTILRQILESPILQNIITPCKLLIAPIQKMIDDIPVPGLSTLFNLSKLLEETVLQVVDNALGACVGGYLGTVNSTIDSIANEVNL
jgi:uncharacterized protein (DUF697 family)